MRKERGEGGRGSGLMTENEGDVRHQIDMTYMHAPTSFAIASSTSQTFTSSGFLSCSGSQGATRSSCWKESRWVLAIAYMFLTALLFFKTIRIPAVEILNGQARYGQPIGVLPKHCRPIVGLHPMYCIGSEDVETMAGMAVMPAAKRLTKLSERDEFFNKLPVKDEHGQLMGREEITAEALGLLVAGFDTTSHRNRLLHFRDPQVQ
ncbi:hypothetical protein D9758_014478 [Tetrapyrgos nigripes]|uniref:Uncharacterized protein n=1 Tax=Tetrapyrgos nigripes TaxID=182062 RepID=A0A8H5C7U0_9AGAR|nr:hypothetical protein D9758_014478 [Tetrapyrgos nigripes]